MGASGGEKKTGQTQTRETRRSDARTWQRLRGGVATPGLGGVGE